MGIFDTAAMVIALIVMLGVIGTKILSTQLINRMQNSITVVNDARQKTMGELKRAQLQKKVVEQNQAMLAKKKAKIQKKIDRLRKELGDLKEEVDHRQQIRDLMRGKVIRPTPVVPQEENPAMED